MKGTTGRHEEFGTPSWAVLLAAVLAMAVGVSLAHPRAGPGTYPQQRRFDVLPGLQHLGFFHADR